jgi:geranylgeranyl reductase family protein
VTISVLSLKNDLSFHARIVSDVKSLRKEKQRKEQVNMPQPSESNTSDVVIIGGGPAGSTSGYILSRAGLKVTIVDKAHFPRPKLCAGMLTQKTIRLVNSLFGETADSLRKKDVINFETRYFEIFFRNRCIAKKHHGNTPFYYVDRSKYDNFFLQKAKAEGAEVFEGENAVSVDSRKNEIVTSGGKTLRSKYIIAADGAYSRVRRDLFFERHNPDLWLRDSAMAFEAFVERKRLRKASSVSYPRIFYGYVKWGYAWLFPNRDRVIAGLGGLNVKNGRKLISSFHDFLSSIGLSNCSEVRIQGHAVPYGNFLENPVRESTLLVGDAAGLADPLLGEGIYYAHKSAELASLSIIQGTRGGRNAGAAYRKKLEEQVYPQLMGAKNLRRLLFSDFNTYSQYVILQVMLGLFNERILRMIHNEGSYLMFK